MDFVEDSPWCLLAWLVKHVNAKLSLKRYRWGPRSQEEGNEVPAAFVASQVSWLRGRTTTVSRSLAGEH